MKTIWKFPLAIVDFQTIMMPDGAMVLIADMQGDALCLWAIVDPEAASRTRGFWVVGTGHQVPNGIGRHIGTTQMHDGALIWHVFESAL